MPGIARSHEINVQDHRLQYLSLAARHGSMRAAADYLGIAPSSISRQITLLERALQIDLVEKGSHKMQLSDAGRLLIDYYDKRLADQQELLMRLAEYRNVRSRVIRVASAEGMLGSGFLTEIKSVVHRFPDTNLDLITADTETIQRMILNDDAQIGLLLERPVDVRLKVHSTSSQPLHVAARADHPLMRGEKVELVDLAKHQMLLPGRGSRIAEVTYSVMKNYGLTIEAPLTTESIMPIIDGIKAGLGVAIMPALIIQDQIRNGGLTSRPIACPEFEDFKLHVVSKIGRRLSPAALALLNGFSRQNRQLDQNR
ncbi:MAG: LysR family transcriptional regulator [Novosphingobium sp.]